jgi:uncharacterized protein (TIGR03792 family)
MVIEMLTFAVSPEERSAWLEVEERTWSRFLEQQPGFVRKEMWLEEGDESHVHAVIWWESMEKWKAIGPDQTRIVDDSMGEWLRHPTMRVHHVIREC